MKINNKLKMKSLTPMVVLSVVLLAGTGITFFTSPLANYAFQSTVTPSLTASKYFAHKLTSFLGDNPDDIE